LPPFKYLDEAAFVTGGQLVAHLPEVYAVFGKFRDLQLSAKLIKDPTRGWMLQHGVASARLPADALLHIVGVSLAPLDPSQVPDGSPVVMVPVCMNHPLYEERKRELCSLADISYAGPNRRSSLCDGASWGWRFDASLAKLVGVRKPLEPLLECPEGLRPGVDDHCSTSTRDGGAP
jgi:hypothetical protein